MFTGIVEEVGTVRRLEEEQGSHQYRVSTTAAFAEGVKTVTASPSTVSV